MTLSEILLENALFVERSNVTIDRDSRYSWVDMKHNGETFCFLQGEEADQFNDECERIYNEVATLGIGLVEMAQCHEYMILLDN